MRVIGWLRFLLALVVVEGHLSAHLALGRVAVVIFYWLSGVVITAVFASKYKGQPVVFLVNRGLRLYPSYWLCYLPFLLIWARFWSGVYGMGMPDTLGRILEFAGIVRPAAISVIPQGFAVTFEIICYCLVAVGAFSSARRSLVMVTASLALANYLFQGEAWQDFYFSPLSAIAFFGLGSLAYWHGLRLPRDTGSTIAGEMSYPIFLSHWGVGAVIAQALDMPQGWPLFFVALPPTLLLSWLLVVLVERPVERYRRNFRKPKEV